MTSKTLSIRSLVIEDNIDDYLLLVDHLESSGILVTSKRVDNEEQLRSHLKEDWDVIFSDFSMPKLTGREALSIVRDVNSSIPFIYVSGTIEETAAVKAIKAGAQNYVMKTDLGRLIPVLERELQDAKWLVEKKKSDDLLKKFSLAINQSADSVFITDNQGHIEYVNPTFERLSGYQFREIKGLKPSFLRSDNHDNRFYQNLWNTIKKGKTFSAILINKRKDGSTFHEEKVITPLFDNDGKLSHFISTGRDISPRVDAEKAQERLQNIIENTLDLVAIVSERGTLLYANRSACASLGIDERLDLGKAKLWSFCKKQEIRYLLNEIGKKLRTQNQWQGELEIQPKSSSLPRKPVSLIIQRYSHSSKNAGYYSLIARDLSEKKRFEAEIAHQATHDSLTLLPNRQYLISRMRHTLARSEEANHQTAILLVDIQKFKEINDSLGHLAGDQLLKKVAQRLQNYINNAGMVARLGSDQFAILLEYVSETDDIVARLNSVMHILKIPLTILNQELFISFAVGISIFPRDARNENDLLKHALTAMYQAKSIGYNQYQFYSSDMNLFGHERIQMDTELRYAIANDELCLFYQPQVFTHQKRLIGFEALIRWKHPIKGIIPPAKFIHLLETSGLIISVGEFVIKQACQQIQKLHRLGFTDLRISVNVSAAQMQDPEFLNKVYSCVKSYAIPKQSLELEITENMVMQDPENAAQIMVALNEFGVRTAIDDFGTGYSSLAYLKRFPVSVLKIDQSFVFEVAENASDAAIVEASTTLAHKLGLEVIAEGVEDAGQLRFLESVGCDIAQGYYISRPLPEEEAIKFAQQLVTIPDV